MMTNRILHVICLAMCLVMASCGGSYDSGNVAEGDIFPDYRDIVIPPGIAPLNFSVGGADKVTAVFESSDVKLELRSRGDLVRIPPAKWKSLDKPGAEIKVTVSYEKGGEHSVMEPFTWTVAEEGIDPYIAYRLIDPGYEFWKELGIYQRELGSYRQSAIITNRQTGKNCMNCHSFRDRDPENFLFHMRGVNGATYVILGDKIEKLNTKTDSTISALVYPSWHTSGKYVAFSVNKTEQAFHTNSPDRIEVYDYASDVVVYDVEGHRILSCPELKSAGSFETFPTFTPNGKMLVFCSAARKDIPYEYDKVRYNVCSIGFDAATGTFGASVDTLFNAEVIGRSASFPRVSPNGKFLLFTLSDFGNFSIWHKSSDLWIMDLESGESWPLDEANSDVVDSYHSWSSNSSWIVFSSRRMDGLYTRPYFAHIDSDGYSSKAFCLPQKNPGVFYQDLMKSYNIPEFVSDRVSFPRKKIVKTALREPGTNLAFKTVYNDENE